MGEVALVTLRSVPLVLVGEDYPASTGPVSFTTSDLLSAIAAVDDPEIRNPVLKLGHDGPLTSDQPVFGKILNLTFDSDIGTLYGDIVGVPQWLASVMPFAYPSRSIEGWHNYPTKHSIHEFVLTGLSLLGDKWPGVTNLPELELMFGGTVPDFALDLMETELKVKLAARGVAASLPVDEIRRAFYALPEVVSNYDLWIQQILLDPNELIVMDDGEGALFRIPFEVSGTEVSFGERQQVRIEYVDATQRTEATSKLVFASRSDSRSGISTKKEARVTLMERLAKKLGLSADATEDEIFDRVALMDESSDQAPPDPETDEDDGDDDGDDEETDEAEAKVDEETVTLSRSEIEKLRQQAERGDAAFAAQQKSLRDSEIDSAIRAGKIAPKMRKSYEKLFASDPSGTIETLRGLDPGTIPVKEIGSTPDVSASADAGYPETWLSKSERRRIAAARSGEVPRVAKDETDERKG